MARIETVNLVDDIDGSEAAETVEFALDGKGFEIDLNGENAKELRASLAGFIESARTRGKVALGARTEVRAPRASTTSDQRVANDAIREWAAANGRPTKARGRIPSDVLAAYEGRAQ